MEELSEPENIRQSIEQLQYEVKKVIVGQELLIQRLMICMIIGGHILVEGPPGLAKTFTLQTFAKTLSASFKRIQFTPDLLPSDLIGTRIYNHITSSFEVFQGPIFANLVLADEINRAPAKVQSALLEAMQENQVTIGKETLLLDSPFLVLATQNPLEHEGTYKLPEAQLDRFAFKVIVHYPSPEEEATIIHRNIQGFETTRPILTIYQVNALKQLIKQVYLDPHYIHLAVNIVQATRNPSQYITTEENLENFIDYGASPRGSIYLCQAAQALALISGRDYVIPRDIVSLAKDVLRHRIILSYTAMAENITEDYIIEQILLALERKHGDLFDYDAKRQGNP